MSHPFPLIDDSLGKIRKRCQFDSYVRNAWSAKGLQSPTDTTIVLYILGRAVDKIDGPPEAFSPNHSEID